MQPLRGPRPSRALNWGTPVAEGNWSWSIEGGTITGQQKEVKFATKPGRFVIFERVQAIEGWASAGEVWVYTTIGSAPVTIPDISPPAGSYLTPARIRMNSPTSGAEVWYTVDGTEPAQSQGSSIRFVHDFCVSGVGNVTIKAKAFAAGMLASPTRTFTYTLTDVSPGNFSEVSKSQMDADASSSTLGWTPDKAINNLITPPVWHSENSEANRYTPGEWLRLDFGACAERWIGKVTYRPRSDYPHGTFTSYKIFVTSSSSTNPNDWGSPADQNTWTWPATWPPAAGTDEKTVVFGAPKKGRYVIFQRMGSLEGWASAGEVGVFVTGSKVEAPVVSPVYNLTEVTLTASTSTPGAQIYYTTDGTDPSSMGSSSTLYSVPVKTNAALTTKWKAIKSGYADSETTVYAIQKLPVPSFDPVSGTLTVNSTISITAPGGAQLKVLLPGPTLIDSSTWQVGTWGSQPGFLRIGADTENKIEMRKTPHGAEGKVWVAYNDANSDADGGWDSANVAIDKTKMYRFSVWVKKNDPTPATANGFTYLGCKASSVSALTGTAVDSVQTNPYFWYGQLPVNEWHLLVGHVYPSGYLGTTVSAKVYNSKGVALPGSAGVINEFRWLQNTSTTTHRSYLYYCTDPEIRQEFWNPRLEVVTSINDPIDVILAPTELSPKNLTLATAGNIPVQALSCKSGALASDVATSLTSGSSTWGNALTV